MSDLLEQWHDPVFYECYPQVPTAFGQAFHQGCQLADVALAAGLSNDQVVAIGKRTIRRTGWLKRI
jgi:hypothetical protein